MKSPRKLLRDKDIRPRKSMGQNFLSDANIAASIVRRAGFGAGDVVLEIGAGLGALTFPLAAQVEQVLAVESDPRIAALLRDEVQEAGAANITVIEKDILKCSLEAFSEQAASPLKVAGNLPYHISSQVLVHIADSRDVIETAFLMFQKEVAQRIAAGPSGKSYGRLSVLAQYCAEITPLMSVTAAAFFPRPKVDSQVIALAFHHPVPLKASDERQFFGLVKAAFGKRRKTLKNALLGSHLDINEEALLEALKRTGIDPGRRAETLSVGEFVNLSNVMGK